MEIRTIVFFRPDLSAVRFIMRLQLLDAHLLYTLVYIFTSFLNVSLPVPP